MIKDNPLNGTLNQSNGSLTKNHNSFKIPPYIDETAIYQNCNKKNQTREMETKNTRLSGL
jgi:hypothetical protein